jgi:alkanesulfonate monooxygenase SsuD/methylene tetrahydromethanopterin reductase-like flavin-dependent oxidoreductase (luciferase family)
MKRIAIYGDGWLPVVIPPAGMKQMWAGILAMAKEAGRDTGKMELVVRANTRVTDAPLGEGRWTFTGSREEIRGDIAACRDIGAAEVAFDPSFENVDGFLDLLEMLRELAT